MSKCYITGAKMSDDIIDKKKPQSKFIVFSKTWNGITCNLYTLLDAEEAVQMGKDAINLKIM